MYDYSVSYSYLTMETDQSFGFNLLLCNVPLLEIFLLIVVDLISQVIMLNDL